MTEDVQVQVGQVWSDNDPRSKGRTLRVAAVAGNRALCIVLTDAEHTVRSQVGHTTRIGLHRFKATASGYRLLMK